MVTAPGSHVIIPADEGHVAVLALPPTSPGRALFPSNVSPRKDGGMSPPCVNTTMSVSVQRGSGPTGRPLTLSFSSFSVTLEQFCLAVRNCPDQEDQDLLKQVCSRKEALMPESLAALLLP